MGHSSCFPHPSSRIPFAGNPHGAQWCKDDHLIAPQSSGRPIVRPTAGFPLKNVLASLRELVGSNGLGPSTSRLSGVCSNQLSYEPMCGGGNRIRTDDPLLAGQVLYQLSYTPVPSQKVPLLRK